LPQFAWVNAMPRNLKTAISGEFEAFMFGNGD
jgi:hypothetical protein